MYLIGAMMVPFQKHLAMAVFLSQLDRGTTDGTGCRGGKVRPAKSLYAALYLYFVMTKPSRELVVTYTRVDGDSKAVRRSYLDPDPFTTFPGYPGGRIRRTSGKKPHPDCGDRPGLLCDLLRQYVEEGRTEDAFLACLAWEEAKDQVTFRRLRDAAFYEHKEERLSKAALDALYGTSITESVSRLEQYARCAYAYFSALWSGAASTSGTCL